MASSKRYSFSPFSFPLVISEVAEAILEAHRKGRESVRTSLDLGLSFQEVPLRGEKSEIAVIGGVEVPVRVLSRIKKGDVYAVKEDRLERIAFFSGDKYYRLLSLGFCSPTLEISGVRMHRTKGITPWGDAKRKVSLLGIRKGDRVLDIGTGLGYTAINALRMGAKVVSIEADENVLWIARHNPWSRDLQRVEIFVGDAFEVVEELGEFDAIVHDPPRLSLAGHLYGREFYRKLYEALKEGGKVVHYTGAPRSRYRGVDLAKGVAERMRSVGFETKVLRDLPGVLAFKPKSSRS